MEIILGKMAGFCGGVTNAVVKTEEQLETKKEIYCLGELTHNRQVMDELEKKGLIVVDEIEEIPEGKDVIFRAHGVPPKIYQKAKMRNLKVIDLTCPKVLKIHEQAQDYVEKGYFLFLIAEKKHPETIGTKGFAGDNSYIIEEKQDISNAIAKLKESKKEKVAILAQTTFSMQKFDEFVEEIRKQLDLRIKLEVKKTICEATKKRQEETKEIAKKVDYMIIIGGKNSANTRKLYDISKELCSNAILIQTKEDLPKEIFKVNTIGVMAGASTPKKSIEEVIKKLKEEKVK